MRDNPSRELAAYVPRVLQAWPDGVDHQTLDGTLVHIDISGFTAMSERLAAKGKVGAEEVAGVLTTVFTELLTIASGLGADMLKFGGDALLLLFTGEDHELRAVRASGEMRARLRTVGKVSTPAGRVSLRMTVGIHSGTLHFFVVGDSHRELIVAGEAATRVVEMEESAEAGEIVLSLSTAQAVPDSHLGASRGSGVLLAKIPPCLDYAAGDELASMDPEIKVPAALRGVVGSALGEGEHRVITAAFVKFHGTDRVLAERGADALCAYLDTLVTTTQRAAEEYGIAFLGTDIDRDGGKIILTAGSPITTGSDEERMLRTVRAIMDRYAGLSIKVGVNRGPAFSGDVGAPFRRSFTVIGDAVNLAARVMARAGDGEILSTGGALDLSTTLFETTPVAPFMVKGKSAPVEAWLVGAPLGRRSVEVDELPLFGRDADLDAVYDAFVGTAPAGLVDVVGANGIGKSRFVRELRDRHLENAWHFSAAEQFESATPYFPYQRLLREVLDIPLTDDAKTASFKLVERIADVAPDLQPWVPLVASVMDLPTEETEETKRLAAKFRKARLHESVEALLSAILDEPAALIIEDAHWLDDASSELTAYLAEKGIRRPWLVITVRRPGDTALQKAATLTVELGPLSPPEARRLAQTALEDAPMLASRLEPLIAKAGGNPLFLLELIAAARAGGGGTDELPDSVEALVLARIDNLDPARRQLLRYASVLGVSFDIGLLADALGDVEPAIAEPASWLALDEFVVKRSRGDMRFRQELFRDVAYSGLPYRTRRRLHERVALAIEERAGENPDELAERLSVHYMRAEVFDKAWHYALIAGNRAKEKYGNADAIDSYQRALKAARHLDLSNDEIAGVAEILGDVSELSGLYEDADRAFNQAQRSLVSGSRTTAITRLMRKRGMLREKQGAYSQALRWFSRALRGLEDSADSSEAVELRLAYGGVRFRQARYDDTVQWAAEALQEADRQRDRSGVAHAYSLLGLAHGRLGSDESFEYLRNALAIYEELGDLVGQANCLNNLGAADYYASDWDRASRRWEQCTEVRRKAGDVVGAAMAENNIANIRSDQGRLDEADLLFRDVRRVLRAAGFPLGVAVVTSNLGRTAARAGRYDEAHELLTEAIHQLEGLGAEQFVLEAKAHLAETHLFEGAVAECDRVARSLLGQLEQRTGTGSLRALLHRVVGYAEVLKGDVPKALSEFERSLELARADKAVHEEALTLEAISLLPRTVGVDVAAAGVEARRLFEQLGVVATPDVPVAALAG